MATGTPTNVVPIKNHVTKRSSQTGESVLEEGWVQHSPNQTGVPYERSQGEIYDILELRSLLDKIIEILQDFISVYDANNPDSFLEADEKILRTIPLLARIHSQARISNPGLYMLTQAIFYALKFNSRELNKLSISKIMKVINIVQKNLFISKDIAVDLIIEIETTGLETTSPHLRKMVDFNE